MKPVRQVLVPIDFSEPSREAFLFAADLAKKVDAKLDVLHVWEAPAFVPHSAAGIDPSQTSLLELVRKTAEQNVARFVDEQEKAGIPVRGARAIAGSPAHAICDAARAGEYDLIVMGTHGRTGLSRAFIGSVAERVVRHAGCPVLTVRPSAKS